MQRYFFHCAYRGTHYRGWQRQSKVVSIQETIEIALSKLLKEKTLITGCGRTDAKVHARQYFFHVDIEKSWEYDLIFRLNNNLPSDIVIYEIIPVAHNAHARRDANSRTYHYFFHLNKNPFLDESSVYYPLHKLDTQAMTNACALLKDNNNYIALCKTPDRVESTICNVTQAAFYKNKEKNILCFQITSNRFLRGMVRALVSELLSIGQGTSQKERLEPLLTKYVAPGELDFAHPQGLYLSDIQYAYLKRETETDLISNFQLSPTWSKIIAK